MMNQSNNKILIAHAFFLNNDSKQYSDKFKPYPPLAALYAASLLRESGYDVDLFDAVLSEGIQELFAILESEPPSMLVVYEDDFNFLTKMCLSHVRDTTLRMIDSAKALNIPVIIHSSDASDNPEIYLLRGARLVIYGEGEQTLVEATEYFSKEKVREPEYIEGIYYLSNDKVKKTSERKPLRALDKLPQPAWDLVEFDQYREAWKKKHGFFSINMVTTRGCPYKCNWCAKPIWGQQYSSHSPEYVAEQLEWLVKNAAPEHIWFADDIFGLKKGWIERFSKKVDELKIQIPFMIQSRADLINEDVAASLKVAGCSEVWLGVESGSQKILDDMDKGITLSQVKNARRLLADCSIDVGFFIQLGYLGEDLLDIDSTREMLLELKPEKIGVSVSYPLPGTPFYQKVRDQMSEKSHWLESNDLDTVFQSTFSAEFYRRIREHLHQELQSEEEERKYWNTQWRQLMETAESYRNKVPESTLAPGCLASNFGSAKTSVSLDAKRVAKSLKVRSSKLGGKRIKLQVL
ncbi:B12-binding domain-containing radical SAM protein [Aliikangiella coralliicola]|uniref:B12-binding domain-containing radical SAM protein n=1 Tax=Aliikangiella coralliicola TaxID=2592383 RepID=A0A545UJ56_9GAMM|nr:radical SAM protein [Aliikangiella coralliicola]TQV89504.1 B12-binding domain-containing radical SAM protein [Aliikangiella coralliicola]